MRSNYVQMSPWNIYRDVENTLESNKPLLFQLLDEFIGWDELITFAFYHAFYKRFGREREYHLESFLRMLLVQRIFHFTEDSQLLNVLRYCREMREFCGLHKVPDASKIIGLSRNFAIGPLICRKTILRPFDKPSRACVRSFSLYTAYLS